MKKTLGGERLGSGNRMQVDLHGFERSTHDLSYIWRSTMSSGTLVPFMNEVALPGDTFDIHLNCDIKTHPTVGPLFGSYKVQLDVFSIPMRLYHAALHNNRLNVGLNMSQVKLPKLQLQSSVVDLTSDVADPDNSQINPSCIFSYLGIRGVGAVEDGLTPIARKFNAIPYLAYWEIVKQYYSNKQEENAYVITKGASFAFNKTISTGGVTVGGSTVVQEGSPIVPVTVNGFEQIQILYSGLAPDPDTIIFYFFGGLQLSLREMSKTSIVTVPGALFGTYNLAKYGTQELAYWNYLKPEQAITVAPVLEAFPLSNIDLMRDKILQQPIATELTINTATLTPYSWSLAEVTVDGAPYNIAKFTQEGLAVKTYQSDLFNNWLSTEWLDGTGGINDITAVDTSSGSFNIDAIVLAKKVYDMLNRIAVSGGSYNDWLEAVYDHEQSLRAESPVYCGGLIKELVFQEVVSNSQAIGTEGSQPLGTLAGKGVMSQKHKGGTIVIRVDEPSYIMGIVSLTPRLDYSQGNKWDTHLDTLDDLHKPNLDQIGFQELITEQMAWWTTNTQAGGGGSWVTTSAGKQPAWINYMTNVNQVRGNFAIANNEMFMTLNRRYEAYEIAPGLLGIKDLTTYIDPTKFNHIFADTAIDAQNFWTQISVDITARRKMSAKIMPNL